MEAQRQGRQRLDCGTGVSGCSGSGARHVAKIRAELGSLNLVKVLGMVNAADGFADTPKVINGFSDLMVEVFGEAIGKHARSAVGLSALPANMPVEVEMIVEVE